MPKGRPQASYLRRVESHLRDIGRLGEKPGVGLCDGQTEAEGAPSQSGRGDALIRRMSP